MFVFRNYTIENLFPEGTSFSGYGDISFIPDGCNRLVWFYQVPVGFDEEARLAEIEAMQGKLRLVVSSLKSGQTLFICSLIDLFPVITVDSDTRIADGVAAFNALARELSYLNPQVRFIDVSEYFAEYPKREWVSWRFYFISQMAVSPTVASGFAAWFEKRILQISGNRRKCLVLDLDNTIWGGVLGEDGIDGIKIGGDYPGNAFLYFQQALSALSKTGVILAVCSKNNEADVLEVWEKNPFIHLGRKYISAYRINWNNKADNIRELAAELNIGLDSMVFVDDNPTERELVRRELPMVAVPDFPKKPYGLMELYSNLVEEYFRSPSLTEEDKGKTEQYRANAMRAQAERQFSDLAGFIRSLNIKIRLMSADSFNIPRIAQMTQKTNQFNLTTHRYSDSDIQAFVDHGYMVKCASVSDRFGDNGITGAAIIRLDGEKAHIESFLLSCRILGKGIETAILNSLLNHLFEQGIKSVTADFIRTAKNSQVADFYDRHGFELVEETSCEKKYALTLTGQIDIPDSYTFI